MSAHHGSGKMADEAVAWVRDHPSGKLGTIGVTEKGLRVVAPDTAELLVCGDGPWNRLFVATDIESGDTAIVLTTSRPFRHGKDMAQPA